MNEVIKNDIPKVKKLLKSVLNIDAYKEINRGGGLTNHTYHVLLNDNREYIIRIPGEGTEELINRNDEKISTELANKLDIDAKLLYFGSDGSKVTEYIKDAVTMNSDSLKKENIIKEVACIFSKLHNCNIDTGVKFEVFDMASNYELIINNEHVPLFDDYEEVKDVVMNIKDEIDSIFKIKKVPCHNDSLCENWVMGENKLYLIDWEYAGMNDGMWDLADVSIEANYTHFHDELLLKYYFKQNPDVNTWKHLLASKIYVDYLWTLWALTRVPYGDSEAMNAWAQERYNRLKDNIKEFNKLED